MDALWEWMESLLDVISYHGWDMDAREWIEFVGTSSWLPHGCSAGMDGVVGTLSWLPHGCSVGKDRVCRNVIMVATWMLCGNGWSLLWTLSWLGHGCSAGMDGVCGNVIRVVTWMLCGNGWSLWERFHGCHMDALWEWMEFVGTFSWLPHGCSVGMDRVCGSVIMVATWMLCGNG